ncbi:unnamed protein product [Mytilus edulis]|uniref:HTH psq-type domain-containing protein n=1 Tax=Mytilus edulis TaxID=6550 RepID=A0A8S3S3E1_MYTED|nr:unnamed protein product [Mytilus edulis]
MHVWLVVEEFRMDSSLDCVFPDFIVQQNLHINALELLSVIVCLKLWGQRGRKIYSVTIGELSLSVDLLKLKTQAQESLKSALLQELEKFEDTVIVGEKKRGYSLEMLKEAGDDVVLHGKSIRGAAKRHNVPESTLRCRLSDPGGVADVRMGGPTIFTPAEETQLAVHCTSMADKGYGYTRWQIIEIACNMSQAKDKHIQPTKYWFYGFLSRNPQVKMVQPKRREKIRNDVQTGHVTTYFAEPGTILNKYSLINKPAQTWNIDETGISLDHSPQKVLSRRGCDAFSVTSGRSSTTTLVAAVSALGETIPPYIIYKGQRLTQELVSHGMPGSKFNNL